VSDEKTGLSCCGRVCGENPIVISEMMYTRHANEPEDLEERLLENEKEDESFLPRSNEPNSPKSRQCHYWWTWVLQAIIFLISLILFILSQVGEPSDAACTQKLFAYCSLLPHLSQANVCR
jgi:hypothetical protein